MRKYRIYLIYLIIFCSIYTLRVVHLLYGLDTLDAEKSVRLRMRVTEQYGESRSNHTMTFRNFRVILPIDTRFNVGDEIELIGKVESRVIGVIFPKYTLKHPSILHVDHLGVNNMSLVDLPFILRSKIDDIRSLLLHVFDVTVPNPQADLLAGILLGSKASLSKEFYDDLVSSGTLHVVAASGFNISIVAAVIVGVMSKTQNKSIRTCFTLVAIWFYAVLAGLEPSIVRAATMFTMSSVALVYGRESTAVWSLILTSSLMLLINPFLVESVGFWLSVSATWGVLTLSSGFATFFDRVIGRFGVAYNLRIVDKMFSLIKSDLSTTLAAQLATLPIILFVFSRVSLVAPIVNILVLWLIPLIMFLGVLILVFYFLIPPLSYFFAYLAWLPLTFFIKVVDWFGGLKFASLSVSDSTAGSFDFKNAMNILGCYFILIAAVEWAKNKLKKHA